jgi:hypothetical protein
MSPPSCCHAAAVQHCCCHHRHCAATTATMLPRCCRHTATTATLLPPPRCQLRCCVTIKLPPPPLPPRRRHCHRHCQAATAATKLPLLPLSTLQNKFDNEKEFCKMTDVDFFWLSQLFQPGIEFLHGEMLPIFDALVNLSLNHNNL